MASSQNMQGITAEAMPDMTLDALLDAVILRHPNLTELLIVSHGRDGGLSLRFDDRSRRGARANHLALGMLAATGSETVDGITVPAMSDSEVARIIGINEELVRSLRNKMR